jgi:ribosomal protein S18 acetylase RimI-like enzyme
MIRLEPLTGRHDRSAFDSGVAALDRWLRQTALQHQSKGISRTFVAVPADEEAVAGYLAAGYGGVGPASILGFYALAAAVVSVDDLPGAAGRRLPRHVPVTRLGRLAVHADFQAQGLGRLLLADALNRARGAAQSVGSAGVFVDAKDDSAVRFYQGFGFQPCADQPLKLYLPIW